MRASIISQGLSRATAQVYFRSHGPGLLDFHNCAAPHEHLAAALDVGKNAEFRGTGESDFPRQFQGSARAYLQAFPDKEGDYLRLLGGSVGNGA